MCICSLYVYVGRAIKCFIIGKLSNALMAKLSRDLLKAGFREFILLACTVYSKYNSKILHAIEKTNNTQILKI